MSGHYDIKKVLNELLDLIDSLNARLIIDRSPFN